MKSASLRNIEMKRVIIVGCGVAGAEAGTFLGQQANVPLKIIEIESEPQRRFGGWGFQKFPGESTNLAMRKMHLGRNPDDIYEWASTVKNFEFHPDETFPRALMQEYVQWRRTKVDNDLVSYHTITGEAVKVSLIDEVVYVEMQDGSIIQGNYLVMASGSISVKVPQYLDPVLDNDKLIIDPLTLEGHQRKSQIPQDAKVLILGTGLTGEEQVHTLLKSNHTDLTLFSRGGQRHFSYPKKQTNLPLVLEKPPEFLMAETPEEFTEQLNEFFGEHLGQGRCPEDIFIAIRPFWDEVRADLGGCYKAAERLRMFRRTLATNSIGAPWEVSKNLREAEHEGKVRVIRGAIKSIKLFNGQFEVRFEIEPGSFWRFDYIINAVGRNIIRHSIWEQLLTDGIAKKHAGIGVRVSETGRMVNADGEESNQIWVVGMARAGDHALRHGFLGNTAFNVPMVRSHLYTTMEDLLTETKTVNIRENTKLA